MFASDDHGISLSTQVHADTSILPQYAPVWIAKEAGFLKRTESTPRFETVNQSPPPTAGHRRVQGSHPQHPPRRHEMLSGNQLSPGGAAQRSNRRRQKPRTRQTKFPSKYVPARSWLIKQTRNHHRTPRRSCSAKRIPRRSEAEG